MLDVGGWFMEGYCYSRKRLVHRLTGVCMTLRETLEGLIFLALFRNDKRLILKLAGE